jgi:predicted permease
MHWMNTWMQDCRYALRTLRQNLTVTTMVVLSVAIGIGATTAIFSVVDALLLRPLPYPQSERLVNIWLHSPGLGIFRDWPSPGQYVDLQNENHSFEETAIAQLRSMTLTGLEEPERVDGMQTSSALFRMLGAKPLHGRLLQSEDDQPGKPSVAILSYRVWQRMFSSDPQIVGKNITLNGGPHTVAGVLSPDFLINSEAMPAEGPMDKVDVFLPLQLGADAAQNRGDENYNIMARLKSGVSIQQAQADVDVIANRIREKDKRDRTFGMTVTGLQEQIVGDVRRAVLTLLGSVALVLLIACANVANLLLTRAAGREKEVAIRSALGAGGWRIARQLLTESLLLALAGGAVGLGLAGTALYVVHAMNPGNIPRLDDIEINGTVLAFTFGVSVLTGLLFGIAPAWRATRVDLNTSLKSGGRSGHGDGGMSLSRNRLRGLLVVSELALSLMLLTGAGLLIRSFVRLSGVPPGFTTDRVLSMQVAIADPKYKDPKAISQFYERVAEGIGRLPGVKAEGVVSALPLTGAVGWGQIGVEGFKPPPGQELQVDLRWASSDYFRTLDIPLLKGRFFSEHDTPDSPLMAIIDENFAKRFWPHEDPVGKHVWFDPKKPMTIAGVVGVVKHYGLDADTKIAVYFAHKQFAQRNTYLTVRTTSDPAQLTGAVTHEIHNVDSNAAVYGVRTMQDRLYDSLARHRFSTSMLGAFAAFALLLAAVGTYGVMSYLVSQSTHDIGVRMALGARAVDILGLVVRQGMELAGAGIVVGLLGAWAITRAMASLLFGVSATDRVTFGGVAVILGVVALVAILIPARRAVGVDPMVALREE